MATTLAGQSLPDPNSYREEVSYRGGGVVMASGAVKFDLVNATAKSKFTLGWKALTGTQKTALETAWASLKTADGTLRNYDYDAGPPIIGQYTVTRDPAAPNLTFVDLKTGSGVHWAVTISLVEV